MSDEQWWAANEPLLAKGFDPDRFPLAARVGSAAGQLTKACTAPNTPSPSDCNASWTASPTS